MNLLQTLQAGTGYLQKHDVDEARLNMEHLLAHVLGCRRLELYLRFDQAVAEPDLEMLRGLVKRRGEGEPLQHLLGSVEFCGMDFVCDERALVPRPETEHLVEILRQRLDASPPQSVLDLGTGSGCIGLSLAKAWPKSSFTLADVSEEALELARLNASRLGADGGAVRFVRSDLFEKAPGPFDLIVANLPYIPRDEIPALSREVRRDPTLALDGGDDGLGIVARCVADCAARLTPGGWLALEIGHDQAARVCNFCSQAGLAGVESQKDLAGIERFVLARNPIPNS